MLALRNSTRLAAVRHRVSEQSRARGRVQHEIDNRTGESGRPSRDDIEHGAVFNAQLTDVESEVSGLVTYDREVVKVDIDVVAAANRGVVSPTD